MMFGHTNIMQLVFQFSLLQINVPGILKMSCYEISVQVVFTKNEAVKPVHFERKMAWYALRYQQDITVIKGSMVITKPLVPLGAWWQEENVHIRFCVVQLSQNLVCPAGRIIMTCLY